MRKIVVIGVIVVMCLVGSCTSKPAMTDEDLRKEIEVKVNSDSRLQTANLLVRADAANLTATISGSVESQELLSKAVDLAKSAHEGLTVNDELTVTT